MKVVILCGGRGTRFSEETEVIPKPMIEIGGRPILWHIMKIYSHYGFNEFILCLGYRGYIIKEYFSHYFLHMSDVTIDFARNETIIHNTSSEPWKITLVDTGLDTMTAGRLRRVEKYVGNERFMMTYGDGVGNIDIRALAELHQKQKTAATVTVVHPLARFGNLKVEADNKVSSFVEKSSGDDNWINAGFFVLEPEIFEYINADVMWEREPLEKLAGAEKLAAYKHTGFWKPMDTLRDKNELEALWQSDKAAWKVWEK